MITVTDAVFRDRTKFTDQLDKNGGKSDLVNYLSKEIGTNYMLRDRLLKGNAGAQEKHLTSLEAAAREHMSHAASATSILYIKEAIMEEIFCTMQAHEEAKDA